MVLVMNYHVLGWGVTQISNCEQAFIYYKDIRFCSQNNNMMVNIPDTWKIASKLPYILQPILNVIYLQQRMLVNKLILLKCNYNLEFNNFYNICDSSQSNVRQELILIIHIYALHTHQNINFVHTYCKLQITNYNIKFKQHKSTDCTMYNNMTF